jgi:hypothetical protein
MIFEREKNPPKQRPIEVPLDETGVEFLGAYSGLRQGHSKRNVVTLFPSV